MPVAVPFLLSVALFRVFRGYILKSPVLRSALHVSACSQSRYLGITTENTEDTEKKERKRKHRRWDDTEPRRHGSKADGGVTQTTGARRSQSRGCVGAF